MIPATRYSADETANYKVVGDHRANKGEHLANHLWPEVEPLYDTYVNRLREPNGPYEHGFSQDEQNTLEANASYLSLTHFVELRGKILKAAGGNCAYCNNYSADEVDHFLPKSRFGEYSIYSPNLTPICTPCNRKKGNRYRQIGGGSRYIHPYFDPLPKTTPFVLCTVTVAKTILTNFTIELPPDTPAPVILAAEVQFEDLKLAAMYNSEATKEIMGRLGSFYTYYRRGGAGSLESYLDVDARSTRCTFGANHWLPLTLRALANSLEFCNGGFRLLGVDPLA